MNPPKSTPIFSELLFKIRTYEKENQLTEMRRNQHMGGTSTKVHTKRHLIANESNPPSNNFSTVLDAQTREQLEERIRQLETELREKTSAQNISLPRNDRAGQKPSQRTKGSTTASSVPAVPTANPTRVEKFCYNCGEDSHMLPQCTNQANAVLVQKKLCERHQTRQNQHPLGQQQTNLQPNLSLNR